MAQELSPPVDGITSSAPAPTAVIDADRTMGDVCRRWFGNWPEKGVKHGDFVASCEVTLHDGSKCGEKITIKGSSTSAAAKHLRNKHYSQLPSEDQV